MTKIVGFSDFETSETRDDTTSNFEEGLYGLPKDSDWTGILVDKSDIPFLSESSTDVNSAKR